MSAIIASSREGKYIKVEGERLKHLRALRVEPGNEYKVIIEGNILNCRLVKLTSRCGLFEPIENLGRNLANREIAVFQALTADLRFIDLAIDALSQAGAKRFIPVFVKRGISQKVQIQNRIERWQRIAIASMEQCERSEPMEILNPIKIEDIPRQTEGILLSLRSETIISKLELGKDLSIFVGPEGGLDSSEEELLKERGFKGVRLEPFVVKSWLAGAFACSIVQNL
ncbi:MAG: RsmE family RNA methyltransferase [Aquificaceae bacterium]|nr:RsmE family RNA methyltransferase [Aquificaceae bacterium]MDW8237954.1 RsmE family RNA methyltransferase [Aquificaceae bacterium]